MKNYIKILVPTILLSTSIAFSQEVVKENIAKYSVVEVETTDNNIIYEETKAIYPVVFDEEDKNKLNQNRLLVAPNIVKTFKLDNDKDSAYDREITINYNRPNNINYDFMLTDEGLKVWLVDTNMYIEKIHKVVGNSEKKVPMLSREGMYKIILNTEEVYEINVTNMK